MTPQRPQHKSSSRRYFTTGTIGAVALSGLIAMPGVAQAQSPGQGNVHPIGIPAPQPSAVGHSKAAASTNAQTARAQAFFNVPIPASPAPTTVHTVVSGDTVSGIAHKYKTTVSAVAQANNLSNANFIRVGQRLTIPSPVSSGNAAKPAPSTPNKPATSTPSKPAASTSAATSSHVVKAGDTLWALAKKYNTTVAKLSSLNKISSNGLIFVGQRLTVSQSAASTPAAPAKPAPAPSKPVTPPVSAPSNNAASTTYTVKAGDTVSKIAASHKTTTAAIATANKLASVNFIRVGQRLVIPGSGSQAASPAPATPQPSNPAPQEQLVGDSFLHYTYPQHVVAAANVNLRALLDAPTPSRDQMQQMVANTARQMGVDPALAQAVAFTESSFNHASVSPANAIGTMQVIPSSGEWASQLVGRQLNLLDPQDNVTAGVAIIRQLLRSMPNQEDAIASYYQGMGSVSKNGMFSDTENYVAKVKSHMTRY